MPGTAINAINYDQNDDTAAAIEEALEETQVMERAPPQQQAPQAQAPQYNPHPPAPQYQQAPPQQYQQMPPQQYQQPPQMMAPQMPQMPQQGYYQENFSQPASSGFSFSFTRFIKENFNFISYIIYNK